MDNATCQYLNRDSTLRSCFLRATEVEFEIARDPFNCDRLLLKWRPYKQILTESEARDKMFEEHEKCDDLRQRLKQLTDNLWSAWTETAWLDRKEGIVAVLVGVNRDLKSLSNSILKDIVAYLNHHMDTNECIPWLKGYVESVIAYIHATAETLGDISKNLDNAKFDLDGAGDKLRQGNEDRKAVVRTIDRQFGDHRPNEKRLTNDLHGFRPLYPLVQTLELAVETIRIRAAGVCYEYQPKKQT